MSPSKIERPGPALGPIACGNCRSSGDTPGNRRSAGEQTPNRGGMQSSLAILIVFLCALEALLIWAAFGGAAGVFLVWAQFALIVVAVAGNSFYKWVFDDESVNPPSRHGAGDYSPSDSFSERLQNSRSDTYAAGAVAVGAGLFGSSEKKKSSKSGDSSGCSASTPGSSCGGGASTCGGGCSCGGGSGCGGGGCGGC